MHSLSIQKFSVINISQKELEIVLHLKALGDDNKTFFKTKELLQKKRVYQVFIDIEYIGDYHRAGAKEHQPGELQFYDGSMVRTSSKSKALLDDSRKKRSLLDERFVIELDD